MALANVALTDTFDYWRTVTNSMVVAINDKLVYCNTSNANTVSIPSFVSRSSNLYVNIITSTSVADAATGNVASAYSVNTTNELALSYSRAANSWSNTVGLSGNAVVTLGLASANAWSNTKLANTSNAVFRGALGINTAPSAMFSVYGGSADTANGVANFLSVIPSTGYNYIAVGRGVSLANSALYGFANTTTPYSFIGVYGTSIGSSTLNVDINGNVGIGTATPAYKLDVNGAINSAGKITALEASGTTGGFSFTQDGAQDTGMFSPSDGIIDFYNNGSFRVRVASDGKVGIGTQAPAATLDVVGTVSIAKASVLSQTLTDAATISWDTSLGQVATVTLGGARTMAAPTNLKVGTYILHVIQDGSGGRTLTWNSVFKWPAGVAPTLTSTAGRRDLFSFVSDGTNLYGSFLPDVR